MTLEALLLCISAFLHLAGILQTTAAVPSIRPNILLIVADDLGFGDIGSFGNETIRTPNIDSLAREGTLLSHALAASSVCTPSRSAIFTGRYPVRSGMTTSGLTRVIPFLAAPGGLPPEEITFARLAQQNGYNTAHIGKWHLGLHCGPGRDFCHHPLNHGYNYFYGMPWTNARDLGKPSDGLSIDAVNLSARPGLLTASVVLTLATLWWTSGNRWAGKNRATKAAVLTLGLMTAAVPLVIWAVISHLGRLNGVVQRGFDIVEQPVRIEGIHLRFLREANVFLSRQILPKDGVVDARSPFLLSVAFTHAHTALAPTEKFLGRSAHGPYGDIVEELDWAVGQLLDQLDRLGLTNQTFVMFTSDQGAHVEAVGGDGLRHGGHNGPFRGGKGMASMEGGIRVPTLVRWPGHVTAGRRLDTPISLMDLFPTVAALIGAKLPVGVQLDGRDMLPLLTESGHATPRLMVHYCGTLIHAARWVQDDEHVWKVVLATPYFLPNTTRCHFLCPCRGPGVQWHDPPLLYNVAADPSEIKPVPDNDQIFMEMVPKVLNELAAHRASLSPTAPPNQLELPYNLWLPWLQPCCNFPSCQCQEEDLPTEGST